MEGLQNVSQIYPISEEIYISELHDNTVYLILHTANLKNQSSEQINTIYSEIFQKNDKVLYCGIYIENFIQADGQLTELLRNVNNPMLTQIALLNCCLNKTQIIEISSFLTENRQIQVLNLSKNNLLQESIDIISTSFSSNSSLHTLVLDCNSIQEIDISNLQNLKYLKLSNNFLSNESLEELFQQLVKKTNQKEVYVNYQFQSKNSQKFNFMPLFDFLIENTSIQILYMSTENQVVNYSDEQLIDSQIKNCNLIELKIYDNNSENNDFCQFFTNIYEKVITMIDSNIIVNEILDMIEENDYDSMDLQKFDFSQNPQIGVVVKKKLAYINNNYNDKAKNLKKIFASKNYSTITAKNKQYECPQSLKSIMMASNDQFYGLSNINEINRSKTSLSSYGEYKKFFKSEPVNKIFEEINLDFKSEEEIYKDPMIENDKNIYEGKINQNIRSNERLLETTQLSGLNFEVHKNDSPIRRVSDDLSNRHRSQTENNFKTFTDFNIFNEHQNKTSKQSLSKSAYWSGENEFNYDVFSVSAQKDNKIIEKQSNKKDELYQKGKNNNNYEKVIIDEMTSELEFPDGTPIKIESLQLEKPITEPIVPTHNRRETSHFGCREDNEENLSTKEIFKEDFSEMDKKKKSDSRNKGDKLEDTFSTEKNLKAIPQDGDKDVIKELTSRITSNRSQDINKSTSDLLCNILYGGLDNLEKKLSNKLNKLVDKIDAIKITEQIYNEKLSNLETKVSHLDPDDLKKKSNSDNSNSNLTANDRNFEKKSNDRKDNSSVYGTVIHNNTTNSLRKENSSMNSNFTKNKPNNENGQPIQIRSLLDYGNDQILISLKDIISADHAEVKNHTNSPSTLFAMEENSKSGKSGRIQIKSLKCDHANFNNNCLSNETLGTLVFHPLRNFQTQISTQNIGTKTVEEEPIDASNDVILTSKFDKEKNGNKSKFIETKKKLSVQLKYNDSFKDISPLESPQLVKDSPKYKQKIEENRVSCTYTKSSNDQEKMTRKSFEKNKQKIPEKSNKKQKVISNKSSFMKQSNLKDTIDNFETDFSPSSKTKSKYKQHKQSYDKTLTIEDFSNKSNNDETEIKYTKQQNPLASPSLTKKFFIKDKFKQKRDQINLDQNDFDKIMKDVFLSNEFKKNFLQKLNKTLPNLVEKHMKTNNQRKKTMKNNQEEILAPKKDLEDNFIDLSKNNFYQYSVSSRDDYKEKTKLRNLGVMSDFNQYKIPRNYEDKTPEKLYNKQEVIPFEEGMQYNFQNKELRRLYQQNNCICSKKGDIFAESDYSTNSNTKKQKSSKNVDLNLDANTTIKSKVNQSDFSNWNNTYKYFDQNDEGHMEMQHRHLFSKLPLQRASKSVNLQYPIFANEFKSNKKNSLLRSSQNDNPSNMNEKTLMKNENPKRKLTYDNIYSEVHNHSIKHEKANSSTYVPTIKQYFEDLQNTAYINKSELQNTPKSKVKKDLTESQNRKTSNTPKNKFYKKSENIHKNEFNNTEEYFSYITNNSGKKERKNSIKKKGSVRDKIKNDQEFQFFVKKPKDLISNSKKIDQINDKSNKFLSKSTNFAPEFKDMSSKRSTQRESLNNFCDSIYSKILKRHNIKFDKTHDKKLMDSQDLSPRDLEFAYELKKNEFSKNVNKKNAKKKFFKSIETFLKDANNKQENTLKEEKSVMDSDKHIPANYTKFISDETNHLKHKIRSDMNVFKKTLENRLKQYKNG